jgi:hypothetical protein
MQTPHSRMRIRLVLVAYAFDGEKVFGTRGLFDQCKRTLHVAQSLA